MNRTLPVTVPAVAGFTFAGGRTATASDCGGLELLHAPNKSSAANKERLKFPFSHDGNGATALKNRVRTADRYPAGVSTVLLTVGYFTGEAGWYQHHCALESLARSSN